MELRIGQGLGEMVFGMREKDLANVLGKPDKAYDEETHRELQYNRLRCTAWLDPDDDHRLNWIVCDHPDVEIFGARLMGKPKDEVLDHLAKHLDEDVEFEDHGSFESHLFEESWLELQFEYGVLFSVRFGSLFDDNDDPIWAFDG